MQCRTRLEHLLELQQAPQQRYVETHRQPASASDICWEALLHGTQSAPWIPSCLPRRQKGTASGRRSPLRHSVPPEMCLSRLLTPIIIVLSRIKARTIMEILMMLSLSREQIVFWSTVLAEAYWTLRLLTLSTQEGSLALWCMGWSTLACCDS